MGIAERKYREKQALRERILAAARHIVMREGFAALSMRKIAEAIEYSPAALYLHFASRDEIARALCEEGYAQLLQTFEPLAGIADPAERLKGMGRAYVAFGVAHRETYRLIFMEDPSYTGAALGAKAAAAVSGPLKSDPSIGSEAQTRAQSEQPGTEDDPGAAALQFMISALDELKAAGRLAASVDPRVWADAFWATLHGIVALHLTCPVFPSAPLDTVVGIAMDTWLGAGGVAADADPVGIAGSNANGAVSRRKSAGAAGAQSSSQDNAQVNGQAEAQAEAPSEAQDGPGAEPAATRRRATKKAR
ncbi:TetR/AcrR family transcriptional regulator [Paraburkholderia caledonica]|uniref:TetR/AcrR family transcriptional regulator n=1 Tax=Paraburkholderia caledonica TaxID=134536 RepID=UPI0038B72CBD